MGCDIHAYVEYKTTIKKINNCHHWSTFGGRINPGRNYNLFGLLAGVRTGGILFEVRGLPKDVAFEAEDDNRIFITARPAESQCTLRQAQEWEARGHKIIVDEYENPTWVEHPDWHTHSWLTVDEFRQVIDAYKNTGTGRTEPEPEYEALLVAMEKLAEFYNGVRIVFWFDN